MPVVPGVLLDHVHEHPAAGRLLADPHLRGVVDAEGGLVCVELGISATRFMRCQLRPTVGVAESSLLIVRTPQRGLVTRGDADSAALVKRQVANERDSPQVIKGSRDLHYFELHVR